jgi:pimeloyl-ACP methyl ester carboxylesterase
MKHHPTLPLRRARSWRRAAALGLALIGAQEMLTRWYYRHAPPPTRFHTDERTAWTPAWREALTPLHFLTLAFLPPVARLPRGDGAPVLLVAGFLTKGRYLERLRRWLERLGYDARIADIGWNADCFAVLTDRLLAEIAHARVERGVPVHLIGHSLGGALARAATVRAPDTIASLAVLGAPVRGLRLHPSIRLAAAAVRVAIRHRQLHVPDTCATYACPCETVQAMGAEMPDGVPYLTVATEDDGVADWRYALDPLATRVVAVRGSHLGLVFNRAVYQALAEHLAAARRTARAAARSGAR